MKEKLVSTVENIAKEMGGRAEVKFLVSISCNSKF